MSLSSYCKFCNETQANMTISLKTDWYTSMTYGGSLRVGINGADPFVETRDIPEKVLMEPEMQGHKLLLNMWHGRKEPKEQMQDWGFDANSVEGYVPPEGNLLLFLKDGVKVITWDEKAEKGWAELWVPMVEDMLFFGGNYYGDWSADNTNGVE